MRFALLLSCLCWLANCHATEPTGAAKGHSPAPDPIAFWTFDQIPEGDPTGQVKIVTSELTSPSFPDFPESNSVLSLAAPSYVQIPSVDDDRFDFDNGDWITVESWVNPRSLAENAYIVSKGRTGTSGRTSIDQNWAVRLRKRSGEACLNFLFRSQDNDSTPGDWHRWTSTNGFGIDSGWHHIAVSYQFGNPKSIIGFVDGRPVKGTWDMGGATEQPPIQSESRVWIGSAMNGNRGNSFDGQIDQLAIYRTNVPEQFLQSRYNYKPQPIQRPEIPPQKILVQLLGPISAIGEIPARLNQTPRKQWTQDAMAFTRLPFNYDSWGVRDDWTQGDAKSMVVRAWANVHLEPGDYQIMVRSRSFSRLLIDGQAIVTTPKQVNRGGAHHVVDPLPNVPVDGMRPHFMSDHERIVSFHSDGGTQEWMYEAIVGGPNYRLEFGETSVAIARTDEMFHLVSDRHTFPLTDDGWNQFSQRQRAMLDQLDRRTRQKLASQQSQYWNQRHTYAKEHLISDQQHTDIDSIIQSRIDAENTRRSKAEHAGQADTLYTERVQPILRRHCARCHDDKQQGELRIFDRKNLLSGGESGDAAIIPGDPDAGYLIELITAKPDEYRMPPKGDGLTKEEVATVKKWIANGATMPVAQKPTIQLTTRTDDLTFLRRLFIDTVGVPPTIAETTAFLQDEPAVRRSRWIDRLLDDDRWADNWVGYWQDVLAENPNLLKPTLNNTGPFRYWIYEALIDNKPIDRFATELIQMRGSQWYGGAGGFAIASQNDVPMAAKAHVIATAFMGVELKCARCHDAPYHSWRQSDLFELAAMLQRKPIKLPATSTVPAAFFDEQERESLIEVTLQPGATIHGDWPFATFSPQIAQSLLQSPDDSREQLAAQVTASRRFAEVIANRIWKRLMGVGIVEPVDDWQGNQPSDPKLLAALADTLIQADYDLKDLARVIFNSRAYQRNALEIASTDIASNDRYFAGPYRRRMTAEQIVDTALHVVGQSMQTEQLTMDVEGTLPADRFLNFGFPKRSWEFTTLANERDRPSLALPRVQAIADVLKAFGWRNSRPEPKSDREQAPNLIQPGALSNGTFGVWLTRLSNQSEMTELMLADQSVETLVDQLFLRLLTRKPTADEKEQFVTALRPGYDQRINEPSMAQQFQLPKRFRYVSWSNHLNTEANVIKVQMEELARKGPPPTTRLSPQWRQRAEDAIWALMNSPEMILVP